MPVKKEKKKKRTPTGDMFADALLNLEDKYGTGVMGADLSDPRIPTGVAGLDHFLGGGFPRFRVVEFYGKQSSGKSTVMLAVCAAATKQGQKVVWVDFERAFVDKYAARFGLYNGKNITVATPGCMEEGFDIICKLMAAYPEGLYVVDSLAFGMPMKQREVDEEEGVGSNHPGRFSRAVGQCLQSACAAVSQYGACLVIINQVRTQFTRGFNVSETTPGGYTLKFLAHMRLKLTRKNKKILKRKNETIPVLDDQLTMVKSKLTENEGESLRIYVVPGRGIRIPRKSPGERVANNEPEEG